VAEQAPVAKPTVVIAAIAEPPDQPVPTTPQFSLSDLPFDAALAQFAGWYASLSADQKHQVEAAMGDVEAAARQSEQANAA
jgi:hypothetical protein